MERISVDEFAKLINRTAAAVRYGVKQGRVKLYKDDDGQYFLKEEAIKSWYENTDSSQSANATKKHTPANMDALRNEHMPSQAASKQKREFYLAEQERLETERISGNLLEKELVEKAWNKLVQATKTKLIAVPSKFRQRVPEFKMDEYRILETLINEALIELSREGDTDDDEQDETATQDGV